jgi:hypothetical protein
MPVLIPESLREDLNQNGPFFPLPAEQSARQRQTPILSPIPVPPRRLDSLAAHAKEISRRDRSQVGILCDLLRPPARPFGEISFGQRLQTPRNASEEMFPMPASRFFLKHLPILLAQTSQARPAQVLNFHQYGSVHGSFLLSASVNHSHMNALCRRKGKCK